MEKPYLLYQKIKDRAAELLHRCPEAVIKLADESYDVKSSKSPNITYNVQSALGFCSCFSGSQGGFCKHQAAVHIKHNISFPNCPTLTADEKKILYHISTGSEDIPCSFFEPMTCSNIRSDSSLMTSEMDTSTEVTVGISAVETVCERNVVNAPSHSGSSTELSIINEEIDRLMGMLQTNSSDDGLMKAAKKFGEKLRRIQTPAQLQAFFSDSTGFNFHRRRKITVQPTSISRRREGSTHGSALHPYGRSLHFVEGSWRRALKRPRNLSVAIAIN